MVAIAWNTSSQSQSEPHTLSTTAQLELLSESSAATLIKADRLNLPIRLATGDGEIAELQGFIGRRPTFYSVDNAVAADSISTDNVYPGNIGGLSLSGLGQFLGIWDAGLVRTDHQEFIGRVTAMESLPFGIHGTHVGGTMVASGVDPDARGMAFEAELKSWEWNHDTAEMIIEQLSSNPILVSNHSYGAISGWKPNSMQDGLWGWFGDLTVDSSEDAIFGYYGIDARDWDQVAHDFPEYLIVKSVGNDRDDTGPAPGTLHWHLDPISGAFIQATDSHQPDYADNGFDTIGGGKGVAKNILTIGAVADIVGGYTVASDVVSLPFSGWGPTDDGRIKPDLVANGDFVRSTTSFNTTGYANASGTSMATASTSGSIALLHQHAVNLYGQPLLAATIRALTTMTADDAGAEGPDYRFGWGLLNTASAAAMMTKAAAGSPHHVIEELVLNSGATHTLAVDVPVDTDSMTVSIAWTDMPGTPVAFSKDPTERMLVNDLDLRITSDTGTIYLPWRPEPASPDAAAGLGDNDRDVIEQVKVNNPPSGSYFITITHKGTLTGMHQAFSLVSELALADLDSDGISDSLDLCAETISGYTVDAAGCADSQVDTDSDSFCDPDAPSNGPSSCAGTDAFPDDPDEWIDTDLDGIGNNADTDDDNDFIQDSIDAVPLIANNNCIVAATSNAVFSEVVSSVAFCAAQQSITTQAPANVTATGQLHLISPIVRLHSGFSASALRVENTNPCPGC